ncbi:hypothetical protein M3Y97_00328300 [Aphelenchoides bicaudatus]|nr:hypothetical protein M3Y97_00328300 [Aphelenchoides bicaudatus]
MSIAGVICKRFIWLFRLISSIFRSAIDCIRYGRSGAPRIGELPFVRSKEERTPFINEGTHSPPANSPSQQSYDYSNPAFNQHPQQSDSWNTWDDRTFGIETKIEEYRQKMQQQKQPANNNQQQQKEKFEQPDDDLFSDLQPKLKAAKTYRVQDPVVNAARQAPRQSLFEVKEMDPFANRQFSNELGEIDLNAPSSNFTAESTWDAGDIDVPDLDEAINEQKRRDASEKQRLRREEHERRLQQKRGQNQKLS